MVVVASLKSKTRPGLADWEAVKGRMFQEHRLGRSPASSVYLLLNHIGLIGDDVSIHNRALDVDGKRKARIGTAYLRYRSYRSTGAHSRFYTPGRDFVDPFY
jgi:hypothetical protein